MNTRSVASRAVQRGHFNPASIIDSAAIALAFIAIVCTLAVAGTWETVNALPRNPWAWAAWWLGVAIAVAAAVLFAGLAWLRWGPT